MDDGPPARPKKDTSAGFRPLYDVEPEHVEGSFRIARLDGLFEQFNIHPRWLETLRRDAFIQNAQSSSSIEGNPLSPAEAADVVQRLEEKRLTRPHAHEREIAQHYRYFQDLEEGLSEKIPPLSVDDLGPTHERLLQGVVSPDVLARLRGPGLPKRVYFGGNEGTPPERVYAEIRCLFAWYDGPGRLLPLPIRIAIWFHEFQSIHPFADGNGRVGRALTHRLLATELPNGLLTALDVPFNRDRAAYYFALDAVRESGRLNEWVGYFLRTLEQSYDASLRILERLSRVPAGFRGAEQAVLEYALRTGAAELRVAPLVLALEVYRPITISLALKSLQVEHGLLRHNGKRGRSSAYLPSPTLEELAAPALHGFGR